MSCEKESEEMREFIHNLLYTRKTHGLLLCGSAFEMPVQYAFTNLSDIDVMYFPLDICALPADSKQTPCGFKGKILRIQIDVSHPGFARLYDESHSPIKHSESGPASTKILSGNNVTEIISKILFKTEGVLSHIKLDRVYAIYCPCWPSEAVEWISRERKYGWPSNDVVERIVKRGYHFVEKSPHSSSSDYTLWRISFSLAETILIHTWTDDQKYVYHLLKLIKNKVLKDAQEDCKTILCSYFLKTLMFWACEEMRPEFWEDKSLENCVTNLLCLLIEWLIGKCCRNYFIPNNNMLSGITDCFNLNEVIKCLSKHCDNRNILQILSTSKRAYSKKKFKISIPNKLLLYVHSLQVREFFDDPLEPDMNNYVLDGLTRKDSIFWYRWVNLHKAITIHLRLMSLLTSCGTLAESTIDINLALVYFMRSLVSVDETHSERTLSLGDSFNEILACLCKEMKLQSNSLDDHQADSLLNFKSSVKCGRRVCCYRREEVGSWIVSERQGSFRTSTLSPILIQAAIGEIAKTVKNPCFLVSAAFLANFCHTTLKVFDRRLATTVFENMFVKLLDTSANIVLSKRLYSIAITHKLSAVFDKHFQTVLGFLTLCRLMTKSSESSSVIVRICPTQLLKYLGLQFARYAHFRNDRNLNDFHSKHSFHLAFVHHEQLSEKFMAVVRLLSQFSKRQD